MAKFLRTCSQKTRPQIHLHQDGCGSARNSLETRLPRNLIPTIDAFAPASPFAMNAPWRPAEGPELPPDEAAASSLAAQRSFCLRPGMGRGWAQMHEFGNGLVLGRL